MFLKICRGNPLRLPSNKKSARPIPTYQEYIKSFQREMSFPKPQRGDIFIETEKPKHTKLQRSDIESIIRLNAAKKE